MHVLVRVLVRVHVRVHVLLFSLDYVCLQLRALYYKGDRWLHFFNIAILPCARILIIL